jgi:hypothetical protein
VTPVLRHGACFLETRLRGIATTSIPEVRRRDRRGEENGTGWAFSRLDNSVYFVESWQRLAGTQERLVARSLDRVYVCKFTGTRKPAKLFVAHCSTLARWSPQFVLPRLLSG